MRLTDTPHGATTSPRPTNARRTELQQLLEDRRRDAHRHVHTHIRDVRAVGLHEVLDTGEDSESDIQRDLELGLIQMRAETLARIEEALIKLHAGEYGYCSECAGEIAERRLRALPFAVRCRDCEERREQCAARADRLDLARGAAGVFSHLAGR